MKPKDMKRKLTITMDSEVLLAGEQYARSRGMSLSSLIELFLRSVPEEGKPSFASRWRGQFRAAEREDARYNGLARKYL